MAKNNNSIIGKQTLKSINDNPRLINKHQNQINNNSCNEYFGVLNPYKVLYFFNNERDQSIFVNFDVLNLSKVLYFFNNERNQ